MIGLQPGESIQQARLSIWPMLEQGRATWSFTTIRQTHGGRIPQILTEQSGYVLCPGRPSEWVCAEVLYSVLRDEVLVLRK